MIFTRTSEIKRYYVVEGPHLLERLRDLWSPFLSPSEALKICAGVGQPKIPLIQRHRLIGYREKSRYPPCTLGTESVKVGFAVSP